jgi:hypothetical protein
MPSVAELAKLYGSGDALRKLNQQQAAKALQLGQQQRQEQLKQNVSLYDQLAGQQREKLLSGFRTEAETSVARSLDAAKRAASLSAARRGLGQAGISGGRAAAVTEAGLRGQGQQAISDFASQLGTLQAQQRDAFLRGEFDFMNEMAREQTRQAFDLQLISLREKLQRDRESRNAFWGLAGSIGNFIGLGPLGGALNNLLGGSEQSYQAPEYGVG